MESYCTLVHITICKPHMFYELTHKIIDKHVTYVVQTYTHVYIRMYKWYNYTCFIKTTLGEAGSYQMPELPWILGFQPPEKWGIKLCCSEATQSVVFSKSSRSSYTGGRHTCQLSSGSGHRQKLPEHPVMQWARVPASIQGPSCSPETAAAGQLCAGKPGCRVSARTRLVLAFQCLNLLFPWSHLSNIRRQVQFLQVCLQMRQWMRQEPKWFYKLFQIFTFKSGFWTQFSDTMV